MSETTIRGSSFAESSSSGVHSVGGIAVGYYDGPDKLIRVFNHALLGIGVDQKVKLS